MKLLKQKDIYAIEKILKELNVEMKVPSFYFLKQVVERLKVFPYENLTKIIGAEKKIFEERLKTPYYIVRDFMEKGGGGTCFSLVYFAKNILNFIGFKTRFFLADRKYGENTHCGIIVDLEDKRYLVDIGYVIYKPIEIEGKEVFFENKAYKFLLKDEENFINVYTITKNGNLKFRYRIKKEDISEDDFIYAWEKSFEFEMMNHIVLVKEFSDGIIYLKDRHFHKIKDGKTDYTELKDKEIGDLLENIGLKRQIFFKAKSFLKG